MMKVRKEGIYKGKSAERYTVGIRVDTTAPDLAVVLITE